MKKQFQNLSIETSRLDLRVTCGTSDKALREILSDPETMQFLQYMLHDWTQAEVATRRERFQKYIAENKWIVLEAYLKNTQQIIGQIALKEIDWEHKNAVIGCIVHHPFWRQGFGTEMILAILDYAFNELKLHRVLIDPQSNNYKFCGLLEKYGFHFEGIKKEIFLVDNKYYDQSEYSILEQDWPTVRQSMLDSI